jgi:polyphosphate kinase
MSVSETGIMPDDAPAPGDGPQPDGMPDTTPDGTEAGQPGADGDGSRRTAGNGRPRAELPPDRYLDREESWVLFNQRVLELAEDEETPLLERVRFLAIFASNLDEFFMVRVAGLMRRMAAGFPVDGAGGRTPGQLLNNTLAQAGLLESRHAAVFTDLVKPALTGRGIEILRGGHRAVQDAGLPGSHPAGGGPVTSVPLHLRALPQPRGHPR